MMQLSLAYLFAAGLITGLVLLARQNRKQGWRRRRGVWLEEQAELALLTVQSSSPAPTLQHLGDLGRLNQSLRLHGAPQVPAPVEKPLKPNVLA
jgi:hypothetical protein